MRDGIDDVGVDRCRYSQEQSHHCAIAHTFHDAFAFVAFREDVTEQEQADGAAHEHDPHHAVYHLLWPKDFGHFDIEIGHQYPVYYKADDLHGDVDGHPPKPESLVIHCFCLALVSRAGAFFHP